MSDNMNLINAYELAERVRNSMAYNPHDVAIVARNHKFEHEHFLRMIAEMPTLDPVKHANWIRHEDGGVRCSNCEMLVGVVFADEAFDWCVRDNKYCYNCGCKMDGGVKDATNRP